MFTGIVAQKTKVLGTSDKLSIKRVVFERGNASFLVGESVALNGVCSTVVEVTDQGFAVEYMPETLAKTTMKHIVAGDMVHFEKSLKIGDALDGHFVYGHVDEMCMVLHIKKEGDSKIFELSLSAAVAPFVVMKGSITLDGVALTISKVSKQSFEVSLIPYTLEHTTFGEKKVGDILNLEVDALARYVERLIKK